MKLDTGAVVSLISTSTRDQLFSDVPLHSTSTVLTTYTGQRIAVAGRMEVGCGIGGNYSLQLYVARGDGPNLLGRDWLGTMRFDYGSLRVSMVANTNNRKLDSLLEKYQNIFQKGLGKMNTFETSLHLKQDAIPKFRNARPVPFALKETIELDLEWLEKEGVIEKIMHS